jgi:hypothetical protein
MGDLKSSKLIVAKGIAFALMAVLCAALLFAQSPAASTLALAATLMWASARFYYFLFYVLEKYVDPQLRYAGILDLARAIAARRR